MEVTKMKKEKHKKRKKPISEKQNIKHKKDS